MRRLEVKVRSRTLAVSLVVVLVVSILPTQVVFAQNNAVCGRMTWTNTYVGPDFIPQGTSDHWYVDVNLYDKFKPVQPGKAGYYMRIWDPQFYMVDGTRYLLSVSRFQEVSNCGTPTPIPVPVGTPAPESRAHMINRLYYTLLQRPATTSELQRWSKRCGADEACVRKGIQSSPEYKKYVQAPKPATCNATTVTHSDPVPGVTTVGLTHEQVMTFQAISGGTGQVVDPGYIAAILSVPTGYMTAVIAGLKLYSFLLFSQDKHDCGIYLHMLTGLNDVQPLLASGAPAIMWSSPQSP